MALKIKKRKVKARTRSTVANLASNYYIARMVIHGFSTKAIASYLGDTPSQVQSRISLYGLTGVRGKFRNGQTAEAASLIETAINRSPDQLKADTARFEKIRLRIMRERRKATKVKTGARN